MAVSVALRRQSRWAAILAAASVGLTMAGPIPAAEAAFPGRNGRIVFEVRVDQPANAGSPYLDDWDLFTVGPEGASLRQVTSGPPSDFNPAWSPDGGHIAFARAMPFQSNADIHLITPDGGGLSNLTNTPLTDEYAPDWSPDGDKIVYNAYVDNPNPQLLVHQARADLFVMDADGDGVTPLVDSPGDQIHPAWSPDGSWIAFADWETNTIRLVNPEGSASRAITPPNRFRSPFGPEWSPDGEWVAFSELGAPGIWVVRPDGSRLRQLTTIGNYPAWSPDGTKIAFTATSGGRFGLYKMNADASRVRKLIDIDVTIAVRPDWARASSPGNH